MSQDCLQGKYKLVDEITWVSIQVAFKTFKPDMDRCNAGFCSEQLIQPSYLVSHAWLSVGILHLHTKKEKKSQIRSYLVRPLTLQSNSVQESPFGHLNF